MKSLVAKRQLEDTENVQQFEPVFKRSRKDNVFHDTFPGELLIHKPNKLVKAQIIDYDVNPFRNLNQKSCKLELQQEFIRGIIIPKIWSPPRGKVLIPKSSFKHFVADMMKPTATMDR